MSTAIHDSRVFCPACDYNLTGLSRPECPECGITLTQFDMILAKRSRSSSPWLIGAMLLVIPLSVVIGTVMIAWLAKPTTMRRISLIGFMSVIYYFTVIVVPIVFCPVMASLAAYQLLVRRSKRRPRDGFMEVRMRSLALTTLGFVALQWAVVLASIVAFCVYMF